MIVSAQLGTGQNAHAGLWWTFFKSFAAAEETRFFASMIVKKIW